MRLLVIAAIVACAHAAPSGDAVDKAILKSADVGDKLAADIDAKVKLENEAQMAADRARDLKEQTIEAKKDKMNEANDLAKEQSEEIFWQAEESKWQAFDAAQTYAANLEGSLADSPGLARAYGIVVPSYVGTLPGPVISPLAPIAAPLASVVYSQSLLMTDKLKLLKQERAQLEKRIELLEKEKAQFAQIEKERAKLEMLDKQKYEMENQKYQMGQDNENQKYLMENQQYQMKQEKDNQKYQTYQMENQKKEMVKTADLEKTEKKANLEKNLAEKPALLLYNVYPQTLVQPPLHQQWAQPQLFIQNW